MTKTKALELMLEYSRQVIDPALARKIAKAFGYILTDLGIHAQKVSSFHRMTYNAETENLTAVSIYHLAQELALKETGTKVESRMNGQGSYAQDITEKAVEILKLHQTQKATGYVGANEPDTLNAKWRNLNKTIGKIFR